jgi:hypothetical protein
MQPNSNTADGWQPLAQLGHLHINSQRPPHAWATVSSYHPFTYATTANELLLQQQLLP